MNFEDVEFGEIYKCSQSDYNYFRYIFYKKCTTCLCLQLEHDYYNQEYIITLSDVSKEEWDKQFFGKTLYIYQKLELYNKEFEIKECKNIFRSLFKAGQNDEF